MPAGPRSEVLLGLCRAAAQVQEAAGTVATGGSGFDALDELAAAQRGLEAVSALVLRDVLERSVPHARAHGDPFIDDEVNRLLEAHHRR